MRLQGIAKANIVLGAVSLIRLISEMLLCWTRREYSKLLPTAAFDAVVASIWIAGGLMLQSRHPSGRPITAMAAGAAAARTILSMMLLGPLIGRSLWDRKNDPEFDRILAGAGSRFLHYGIEFLYWPVVLFVLLKLSSVRTLRRPGDPELSTGASFAAAGVIAALVEAALLLPILGLVF